MYGWMGAQDMYLPRSREKQCVSCARLWYYSRRSHLQTVFCAKVVQECAETRQDNQSVTLAAAARRLFFFCVNLR